MTYLGVIVGLVILAIMIYLAVDKKSNFPTRIASLAAIALMLLTVVICVFLVLSDNRVPVDESALIVGAPAETKNDGGNNSFVIFLLILFLAGLFAVIGFLAMRENKKHASKSSAGSLETSNNFKF